MRAIALSGLVLLSFAGITGAAPPSTARETAPFDLTYLPHPGPQGIVAVRPAEIARHLPALPLAGQGRMFLSMTLAQVAECNLEAAEPPALADIDECVLGLSVRFKLPTAGERGSSLFGAGTPCCLRTVRPFDWAGAVGKWCPKAEKAEHAGRTYLRVPWKLTAPLAPPEVVKRVEGEYLGIFIPDGRTLVLAADREIRDLLERLKDGKTLELPPGWQEISRDMVAIVLDQRTTPCVKGKWPEEPVEAKPIGVLFDALKVAAFGVSVEETPGNGRLVGRMVALTKDADSAGKTVDAIKTLVNTLRTAMATVDKGAPTADLVRAINAMFDRATLTQHGPTVRGRIDLPFDVIQAFSAAGQRQAETPPQPHSPPD